MPAHVRRGSPARNAIARKIGVDAVCTLAVAKNSGTFTPRETFFCTPFIPKSHFAGFFRHISLSRQKISYAAAACMVFVAFGAGALAALSTPRSEAGQELAPAASLAEHSPIPLGQAQAVVRQEEGKGGNSGLDNDMLFNTPLEALQEYLQTQATAAALDGRKVKLAAYLKEKNSPLAGEAGTIAEQDHWKLILAISFAESTLGKRCYYNNCSGIGGSNIRAYKSLKNWILDFNRLLEKRYKGDTLEQMCGVYVQPCNPNWLLATRQILSELDEEGIE